MSEMKVNLGVGTYSFVSFRDPRLITGAQIFSPKQALSIYKAGPYRWKTPVVLVRRNQAYTVNAIGNILLEMRYMFQILPFAPVQFCVRLNEGQVSDVRVY